MIALDKRIELLDRLKLRLQGHLYIGDEKIGDSEETVPFYVLKCPKHGYVKTYVRGFQARLDCPKCIKELEEIREIKIE